MKILAIATALALCGCASTTTKRIALVPKANSCQIWEVRPSALSTLVISVCWDSEGKAMGMAGGSGTSTIQIPLTAITAGAIITGGVLIGKELENLRPGP